MKIVPAQTRAVGSRKAASDLEKGHSRMRTTSRLRWWKLSARMRGPCSDKRASWSTCQRTRSSVRCFWRSWCLRETMRSPGCRCHLSRDIQGAGTIEAACPNATDARPCMISLVNVSMNVLASGSNSQAFDLLRESL